MACDAPSPLNACTLQPALNSLEWQCLEQPSEHTNKETPTRVFIQSNAADATHHSFSIQSSKLREQILDFVSESEIITHNHVSSQICRSFNIGGRDTLQKFDPGIWLNLFRPLLPIRSL